MATRATIACRTDGGYEAAYLHYDGYPKHAGKALQTHHNSLAKAKTLVAGGDIRSLDVETGAPDYFQDGSRPTHLPCHDELLALAKRTWSQYLYVFDGEVWSCVEI